MFTSFIETFLPLFHKAHLATFPVYSAIFFRTLLQIKILLCYFILLYSITLLMCCSVLNKQQFPLPIFFHILSTFCETLHHIAFYEVDA